MNSQGAKVSARDYMPTWPIEERKKAVAGSVEDWANRWRGYVMFRGGKVK